MGFRSSAAARRRQLSLECLERRELLDATNLVQNGDFESETLDPWYQFGASPQVSRVTADVESVYQGASAALVSQRTATFEGLAQDLENLVPGQDYQVTAQVRLADPAGNDNLTLQMVVEDAVGVRYVNVSTVPVNGQQWSELKGGFRLDSGAAPATVRMEFMGARAGTSFLVDAVTVIENDWEAEANARINQYRKRDVQIEVVDQQGLPLQATRIRLQQIQHEFGFGAALSNDAINLPEYREFFAQHFEWATTENALKWGSIESVPNQEDYSQADAVIEFAKQHGIQIRGHNLVWPTEGGMPQWLLDQAATMQRADLIQELEQRIESIVSRYGDDVQHWDVLNESLDLPWLEELVNQDSDDDLHRDLFEWARQFDADGKLFTNEFGIIEGARHVGPAYRQLLQRLMARGAPVGGIGVEAHFDRGISSFAIQTGLSHLTDLNLPVWITEFDSVHPDPIVRADDLEVAYRTAFSIPEVEGMILWGFWAGNHWRGEDAALVESDWTFNAAGQRYLDLMREWTTELDTSGSELAIRGFHGDYQLTLEFADGQQVVQNFSLSSDSDAPLTLRIETDAADARTVVTSAADAGPGSLRAAIEYANATPGHQTIRFKLSDPLTNIRLETPLPAITDAVTIDGLSQPGLNGARRIVLSGHALTEPGASGLLIASDGVIVQGLAIVGFPANGIEIRGSDNVIRDNFVGLDPSGNIEPNNIHGILVVQGQRNRVGEVGHGNVLSGNAKSGLYLDQHATGTRVEANRVGTDPDGFTARGNGEYGIVIIGTGNMVGGVSAEQGNLVSGNSVSGIMLWSGFATNNTLERNRVGTNAEGTGAVGNGYYGIELQEGASHNLIANSQIAGNGDGGVVIAGNVSQHNRIIGNFIGLNVHASAALGNRTYGVSLLAPNNEVGFNFIGGNWHGIRLGMAAQGNYLHVNRIGLGWGDDSVAIPNEFGIYFANGATNNTVVNNSVMHNRIGLQAAPLTSGNTITLNQFAQNGDHGIDLGTDGVSQNDLGDLDEGANRLINTPVLQSVQSNLTSASITYTVEVDPQSASYPMRIEFFIDDGSGEGARFLGTDTFTAENVVGGKTIELPMDPSVAGGSFAVVATTTDQAGNTSEFSLRRVATRSVSALALVRSQSANNSLDINQDGQVTPLDALLVINELNRSTLKDSTWSAEHERMDLNGDGSVTPLDALLVINFQNQISQPPAEDETDDLV